MNNRSMALSMFVEVLENSIDENLKMTNIQVFMFICVENQGNFLIFLEVKSSLELEVILVSSSFLLGCSGAVPSSLVSLPVTVLVYEWNCELISTVIESMRFVMSPDCKKHSLLKSLQFCCSCYWSSSLTASVQLSFCILSLLKRWACIE